MLRAPKKGLLIVDGRYAYVNSVPGEYSECQSAPAATLSVLSDINAEPQLTTKTTKSGTRRCRRRRTKRRGYDSDETHTAVLYASNQTLHINDTVVVGDNNEIYGTNNKAIGDDNILVGLRCSARGKNNVVEGRMATAYGEGNRVLGPGASLYEYRKQSLSLSARLPKIPVTPRWLDATQQSRRRSFTISGPVDTTLLQNN